MNQQTSRPPFSALIALLSILGTAAPAVTAEPVTDGAMEYRRYCLQCHGHDGFGDGPLAGDMLPEPADLTRISRRHQGRFPFDELARFIDGRELEVNHGRRTMPAWGRHFRAEYGDGVVSEELARGKLLAIIEYLRQLQR